MPSFTKSIPFFGKHTHAAPPVRPVQAPPMIFSGFEIVASDPTFAATEASGGYYLTKSGGTLPNLPYIQAEGSLPFVNIAAKLTELAHHCWKNASAAPGPQRQHQIGAGQRAAVMKSFAPDDVFQRARMKPFEHVKQVTPLTGEDMLFAQDWGATNEFKRVNAYTFRGEKASRGPKDVEAAGGFHPPITRTDKYYVDEVIYPQFQDYMSRRFGLQDLPRDQFDRVYRGAGITPQDRSTLNAYFSWRALVEKESHHIGRMLARPELKNYISTSKYVPLAKYFAQGGGWVYLTRVRGGFEINTGKTWANDQTLGEQEIALPGSLLWADVFGFRQLDTSCHFTGPLYLRGGFRSINPTAYSQAHQLLSGKPQK